MFRNENMYASWDDSGFPLTKANGEPTSKSARKKMRKQVEAQRKRYDKYMASGGGGEKGGAGGSGKGGGAPEEEVALPELDPGFISVIGGTFGNLQALDLSSDMGPFCHVLNLG
uniref:Uncharacterized protein n=2 Tax=Odontella aurita TaxID=265563 RepID=A0A7S4JXY6_9STRA